MEIESNLPLMKSLPVYVFSLIKERIGWLLLKSSMRCFLLTQSLQSKADICVLILWVYVTPSFWRSLYKIDKALLQQELIKQYLSLFTRVTMSLLEGHSLWPHSIYEPEKQVMPIWLNVSLWTLHLADNHTGFLAQWAGWLVTKWGAARSLACKHAVF